MQRTQRAPSPKGDVESLQTAAYRSLFLCMGQKKQKKNQEEKKILTRFGFGLGGGNGGGAGTKSGTHDAQNFACEAGLLLELTLKGKCKYS